MSAISSSPTVSNSFGSITGSQRQERESFAGFVGALLIVFSFMSVLWLALDPASDKNIVMFYFAELIGGTTLAIAFGFKFSRRLSLENEMASITSGLIVGLVAVIVQTMLLIFGASVSTVEGVWYVLLAPVAETMAFVVAIYELFRIYFPDELWTTYAIASDMMFTAFHIWRYISYPNFALIFISIIIGNTLFIWVYHITRNATAPIIGHLIVNIFATGQETINMVLTALPYYLAIFAFVVAVYIIISVFFGGKRG